MFFLIFDRMFTYIFVLIVWLLTCQNSSQQILSAPGSRSECASLFLRPLSIRFCSLRLLFSTQFWRSIAESFVFTYMGFGEVFFSNSMAPVSLLKRSFLKFDLTISAISEISSPYSLRMQHEFSIPTSLQQFSN